MSLASSAVSALPAYEVIGSTGAPAIIVLGGISATRHVCSSAGNPQPGWWESIAGRGRALDTTRWQLVGVEYLDAGQRPDGRPERIVTTYDQADAIVAALDDLNIERAHAVVGASYGGMVALALAERHPNRLERLIVIGAAHRSHPMITGLRGVQRRIVELGLATGRTHDAMVLARELAMTTYRTAREFRERFDMAPVSKTENDAVFPVDGYLRHHGERFAAQWTAARFLALSLSSDLHSINPGRIRTATVLVAEEGDAIVPREQTEELARELGGVARIVDLPSAMGHDAFLTEAEALGEILDQALQPTSAARSAAENETAARFTSGGRELTSRELFI